MVSLHAPFTLDAQKSNFIASCSCLGVANVVVPDAGEEKVRGVPNAVRAEGEVNPVVAEKLKKVLFTVATLARLKTLKASRILRKKSRLSSGTPAHRKGPPK